MSAAVVSSEDEPIRCAASWMRPVRSNSRRAAWAVSDTGRTPGSSDSPARVRISRTVAQTLACRLAGLPLAAAHSTGDGPPGNRRVRWVARSANTRTDQVSSVRMRGRCLPGPWTQTVEVGAWRSAAVMWPSSLVCAPASSSAAVAAWRVGVPSPSNSDKSAATKPAD
jgi:hypothetical protein